MPYREELARILPLDIPNRELLIAKGSRHLELIAAANEYMNLTRITSPAEAAIKHIYDSVAPWAHFSNAQRVLDAGTGAGFPGIPLALVLPHVRFTLSESIQKKAHFVDSVIESLELTNVQVRAERAEDLALAVPIEIITARAVAPLPRLLDLFNKSLKRGARLLLYKGPDVDTELNEARNHRANAEILCRYDLPNQMGSRTLLQICATPRSQGFKSKNEPSGDKREAPQRSDSAQYSGA